MNSEKIREMYNGGELINCHMKFYSYKDFKVYGKKIKRLYQQLDSLEVELYMWYVYSNRYISIYHLNQIWEYLNGDIKFSKL